MNNNLAIAAIRERLNGVTHIVIHAVEARALLDEIERLRAESRWTPVTERLPETHEVGMILIERERLTVGFYDNSGFVDDNGFMNPTTGRLIESVTHWRPLPASPKGDA